ncbi:MAG: hypothetical protein GY820_42770 [Gammaproteobacteria bacterium]|nr:hypothetical protein [Gammaproteobacteria bacterium]
MDFSSASVEELNTLIKFGVYKHMHNGAQKILDRFVDVHKEGDQLGDVQFWEYLGVGVDDTVEPKRPRLKGASVEQRSYEEFYSIEKVGERKAERFKTTACNYILNLKDLNRMDDSKEIIHRAFSDLIERAFTDGGIKDKVGITLSHPEIRKEIHIPLSTREKLSSDVVIATVERFIHSTALVSIDHKFHIEAVRVNLTNRH